MEFKDEQKHKGKDFNTAKDHLLIICEEDTKPKMFLREINPGDVFEDSSFDQIGLLSMLKLN